MTPLTSEPQRRCTSTERARACRQRRRRGQTLFTIRLTQRELGQLEAARYLERGVRDRDAVGVAIEAFISDHLEPL
jgi:hypothetical protein